jgi:dinuclear metal center YbgI/SA1388 family protein
MVITFKDISDFMNEIAPVQFAEEYDNVGPMIGKLDNEISKCLLCVDVSGEVIMEAIEKGANLIISHHPFIFEIKKSITSNDGDDYTQNSLIYKAIENGICIYSSHTNLDSVEGGVNSALATKIGATNIRPLFEQNSSRELGLKAICELPEAIKLKDFVEVVKRELDTPAVKYIGDDNKLIKNIVVSSGSFGDYSEEIAARTNEIDVIVTGELKHGVAVAFNNIGLPVISAEHYYSERVVLPYLVHSLTEKFGLVEFEISENEYGTFKYI